jgi:hypothetical protein
MNNKSRNQEEKMKGQQILKADGLFLLTAGTIQIILEIAGHFWQMGRYAEQFGNSPYTIGFFEAHGLAVLLAIALLTQAGSKNRLFWHRAALAVHLLLGGANLLFWQSFVAFDFVTMGIIATTLHIVFVLGNGTILIRERETWKTA